MLFMGQDTSKTFLGDVMRHFLGTIGLGLVFLSTSIQAQKFWSDDPLWSDPDQLPIPLPQKIEVGDIVDSAVNTFFRRPDGKVPIPRALNVNTLGEVPDSTWFTNRIGIHPMTIEQLVQGPNRLDGPDLSRPLVVIRGKKEGVSLGFIARDARKDIYFIKFDPLKNFQLATSTEVIATKFFYAFGYNVPENYLAFVRRENLWISPEATVTENGKERKMTQSDLDLILAQVPRHPDGTFQILASRALQGKDLGPFQYFNTRPDDPNDIFRHEHRRELRGLRVFASWLNHDDARSSNSKDMYVAGKDQGYVKHHLLDFGSCLGSGSVKPQSERAGYEYILEWGPLFKAALSLGLWDRPWRRIHYPNHPGVGRFEADFFHPAGWKPEYPNPAFQRMRTEDAFWATRTVLRFGSEMIRAIVQTGQLCDPAAEEYLVKTLLRRRDKIISYYLAQINPLDDFRLSASGHPLTLEFTNLGVLAGLSTVESYRYQWFRFDNERLATEALSEVQNAEAASLPVPDAKGHFLMVRIRTLSPEQPGWKKKVAVFIRNGTEKSIVGIEREE